MNGKQAKRIRKIAMTTAHSHNDITTEGVKGRKLEPYEMDAEGDRRINIHKIDIHKWFLIQRKLHKFSLKGISKTIKNTFKQTPRPYRHSLLIILKADPSLV
jgi:hypothetical protein